METKKPVILQGESVKLTCSYELYSETLIEKTAKFIMIRLLICQSVTEMKLKF